MKSDNEKNVLIEKRIALEEQFSKTQDPYKRMDILEEMRKCLEESFNLVMRKHGSKK